MPRTPRNPRAQVLALPRPAPAIAGERLVVLVALALLLAGLIGL